MKQQLLGDIYQIQRLLGKQPGRQTILATDTEVEIKWLAQELKDWVES